MIKKNAFEMMMSFFDRGQTLIFNLNFYHISFHFSPFRCDSKHFIKFKIRQHSQAMEWNEMFVGMKIHCKASIGWLSQCKFYYQFLLYYIDEQYLSDPLPSNIALWVRKYFPIFLNKYVRAFVGGEWVLDVISQYVSYGARMDHMKMEARSFEH